MASGHQSNGESTLWRVLFEEALEAILIADSDRVYVDANPAACRLLGLPHGEVVGRRIDDFVSGEAAASIAGGWSEFLESGEMRGDILLLASGGVARDCEFAAKANILPGLHLSVLRDVTDRKRAGEAQAQRLRESERLSEAFRELAGAYEPLDVTAIVCRAARDLTGADGATFVLREGDTVRYLDENAVAPLWKGQDFPIDCCVSGWAIRERTPAFIENIYDDERVPIDAYRPTFVNSMLMVPVRVPEPVAAIGVYWADRGRPTEEHLRMMWALAHAADLAFSGARHYEEMKRAKDEAEHASRLKDEFLATLSHELRTPLNAMLGWARIASSDGRDPSMVRRAVETIERNAKAQAQLVEDLLDVSSIITGKMHVSVEPVDLTNIIAAAVDSVRPAADAKGVALVLDLDPAAGETRGDARRLQQIVWNVVSNAVKFTPGGGEVRVGLSRGPSHVEISVRDTGRGIPAEFLPFVFDRFRQYDGSTTRTYGGLGLGLSIVRHLVELHGGTVRAESAGPDHGSTFVVSLPALGALREAVVRPAFGVGPQHAAGYEPSLEGVRILAVDDEADTRDFVAYVLAQCGAEVRVAGSAAEALAAFADFEPHLLVSDVAMPGEDGYQLIQRVRTLESESAQRVPAVALTAYARPEDRVRLLSAGYQNHLTKPVDTAELIAVVRSLTRK
jgi:two-component system CheB/CheR fusion protein